MKALFEILSILRRASKDTSARWAIADLQVRTRERLLHGPKPVRSKWRRRRLEKQLAHWRSERDRLADMLDAELGIRVLKHVKGAP